MNKKEKFYKHLFLEANWGCYGYGDCVNPVSRAREKPWLPRVTQVRC